MTAKEMFEKIGFTQIIKDEEYNEYYVLYSKINEKREEKIEFCKEYKYFYAWSCYENYMEFVAITREMHEAIHQQMIELGWLDE